MSHRTTSNVAVIGELIAFSVPSIFSRLANIFVEVVVTFFVAKLGIIVLATYGLAMPLFLVIYLTAASFLMVFAVRACKLGSDLKQLMHYLFSAVFLTLLFSLITMLLLIVLPKFLPWLGQNRQVANGVANYFFILMWVLPAKLLNIVFNQLLISLKKGRVVTVNATIYVLVALLLVYGLTQQPLKLGLDGIGLALVIASWVRFFIIYRCFAIMVKKNVKYCWPPFAQVWAHIKYLLLLGWPLSLQFGSELLSGVVTTLMIGHMNHYAVSVQQATNQARIFIVMVPFGIGQGCAMLVSRYEKAQRLRTLADFIYLSSRALLVGLAMMLPLLLWLLVKPDSFIALFFHVSTAAAIKQLARQFLYIVIMALLFDLLKFSLAGLLRGIGDTRLSMLCSVFGFWFIAIPMAAILGYGFHMGPIGVRLGMLAGLILSTLFLTGLFLRKIRQNFILIEK